MADRSFLDWPFFEPRHKALAVDLDAWAAATLAAQHEAWVNELLGSVTAAEADHLIDQLQAVRNRLAERGTEP